MKVSIQPSTEQTGLIFKKTIYQVAVDVTLSDDEKATCKAGGIERQLVFECPQCDGINSGVLVDWLYDSTVWKARFPDQLSANEFQSYVKEQLVGFKSVIEDLSVTPSDEKFEL
jgi:hypothetical protein